MPEPINLDTWGFASTPLFPGASSIYLTGFESPTDATRVYVYGVDVAQGKFLFAGTVDKRHVSRLLQRTGSDIDALKSSGAPQPLGGIALQPDGPPPQPPDMQEPSVQSFAQRGWRLAVEADQVARKLRR